MRHLVLGTAGHIDHGKSALVRALTGTDPDRLKEEQRRGITIELGFADLELDAGLISFVDVPGHERFVRHMVAGATGLDAVLLVIAADQAVQPQTREHLDICALLGVRRGLVALSKCDLVDDDLREVAELEVREYLAGTFLADAPVVPVSAKAGSGLDELRTAIAGLFDTVPPRPTDGIPRLPVDRSFVLRGFGTVVTGTLTSGLLRQGTEVEVMPGGARGRIRGLQVHHATVEAAESGQRTAVNLQSLSCEEAPRGSMLTVPGALITTRRIWARMQLLPNAPESLTRGGPVRFHQGTCERDARVKLLRKTDDPQQVDVEIFLDDETVLVPGDRFILRRPAPVDTIAGGRILDVRPPRSRLATPEAFEEQALGTVQAVRLRLGRAGKGGREIQALAAEVGLTPARLDEVTAPLVEEGSATRVGRRLVDGEEWRLAASATLEAVAGHHAKHPLSMGVARETLRAAVAAEMPQEMWRRLLDDLAGEGRLRLSGETVAGPDHRVELSETQRKLADAIEGRFRSAGLEPPEADEVLDELREPGARQILGLLVADGRLTKIHDGKLYHSGALGELRAKLGRYARESKTIDVAAFKDLAGVTRKHAIPLLEHLDAERTTRRLGNLREILVGET